MANKTTNLRPIKMWIDGKIFTIPMRHRVDKSVTKRLKQRGPGVNLQHLIDEDQVRLLDITKDFDRYTAKIKLPSTYYWKMQHFLDVNQNKLNELTNTNMHLPTRLQDDAIILHSEDVDSLLKAVAHVHSAIVEIRQKTMPLQFTCIPCIHPTIQRSFMHLQNEIMGMADKIDGLHESIFMNPLKLHLTIDVYSLLNESEQAEAVKALNEYKATLETLLQRTGPLKLLIGTLDCMNNDLRKVNVLYANVKFLEETQEHNLQGVVDGIAEHFYHRGLARQYQDNIKLHMTVINTKYRKCPERRGKRQSIDATKIMETFRDYQFGYCSFDSVHLSHMTMVREDGFYKPLAVLQLNDYKDFKE